MKIIVDRYHYNKFPPKITISKELKTLIIKAKVSLNNFNEFFDFKNQSKNLLKKLIYEEAVLSSKIEGNKISVKDFLEYKKNKNNIDFFNNHKYKIKDNLNEINNYIRAIDKSIKVMDNLPLCERVIKLGHRELMKKIIGKSAGEYRKIPVHIEREMKKNIDFFTPAEVNEINKFMSNFSNYLHYNNDYDDLIKVAILHAEFEAIHPFLDGNGRIGRIFIPLYLFYKGVTKYPYFYMSYYLEKNKKLYFKLLSNVSRKNDWLSWIVFFIKGIISQCKNNLEISLRYK